MSDNRYKSKTDEGKKNTRLNSFELMLDNIKDEYDKVSAKIDELKLANKTKTTTFKQLLTTKMQYKNMLIMYKNHGLIDEI